jgi:hypothetical protein
MSKETEQDGGEEPVVLKGEPGSSTNHQIIDRMKARVLNGEFKGNLNLDGDDDEDESEDPDEEEDESEEEGDEDSDEEEDEGEEESDDDEEDEDEEEEEDEEEDDEEEESEAGEEDRLAPKKPVYAERADGSKIKIPPDAKLIIPINGKDVAVNVHKAISEYSGRYVVDTEMNKVHTERQKVTKDRDDVSRAIGEFKQVEAAVDKAFKKIKEGAGLEAYHELVMLSGEFKDPIEWEIKHLKDLIPVAMKLADMTVEQQNTWLDNRKLQYLEKRQAEEAEKKKVDPEKAQLQAEIQRERQEHQIDDALWSRSVQILRRVRDDGRLAEYGITKLTPATISGLAVQLRASDRVGKLLKDSPVAKKLPEKKLGRVRELVIEAARSFSVTDEELNEILTEAVGDTRDAEGKRTDSEKLGKRFHAARPSKQTTAKPKKKKAEVRSFDELRKSIGRN